MSTRQDPRTVVAECLRSESVLRPSGVGPASISGGTRATVRSCRCAFPQRSEPRWSHTPGATGASVASLIWATQCGAGLIVDGQRGDTAETG
jgi:hypothetical protein